jgi:hypothetical protein
VREDVREGVHEPPQGSVAVNHRAKACIRAGGGRLAADTALLCPLGDRHLLQYDRRAVIAVEDMFTRYAGYGRDLDLLAEIASTMPRLMFADFWHGYLRFLAAEAMLSRDRVRP